MKRPEIISLGEVLWDLFPDGERFGGAPANFACHDKETDKETGTGPFNRSSTKATSTMCGFTMKR